MIGADLVRAAVLAAIGSLALAGVLEIWHLVALVVLFGAGEAFFGPAFGAILPDVVAGEQLVQANALDQLVRQSAGRLIGPALGGFVVAALGAGSAFLVDAATFAVSAACIAALRVRSLPRIEGGERSARAELREGIAFVRSQPWLWATLIAAAVSLLMFHGPLEVLLPFVVRNDLHAGPGAFGAILAAAGAGSVVISLLLSQRGLPRRYLTFMYATWSMATLPLAGYALGTAVWQLMALAFVYGACMSAGTVVWATLMQTRVPAGLRGRVHSLDWFVSIGLTPVSFALTGPVSKAIGIDATLIAAGVVPAVLTAALFFLARLRADEQRHPPLPVAAVAAAEAVA
jgi:DHA3 family tetracycline resistance protein-like MFS transporter